MMLSGNSAAEILKVAAPAATVVAAGAIVGIPYLVKSIQQKWNAYGTDDLKTIQYIQDEYKKHCLDIETSLGLILSRIEGNKEEDEKTKLPIYFQMTEKNVPVLFELGFTPAKDAGIWISHLNKTSPLKLYIEDMINYICLYQSHRDKKIVSGNYGYDPRTLFFEELKHFLLILSKTNFSHDLIKAVEARIKYLDFFHKTDKCFHRGYFSNLPNSKFTILKVKKNLSNNVLPLIELNCLRRSSRERFNELKLTIQDTVAKGIEFLFYIFRDTQDSPHQFIVDEVRNPTVGAYKASIEGTLSGSLLQYLANTPAYKITLPPSESASNKGVVITHAEIQKNDFIIDNKLSLPINTNLLTVDNWWKIDTDKELKQNLKLEIGVLPAFKNEHDMNQFLYFHGYLQKLCLFYIICEQLYALSGDGGDLMVYGHALNLVECSFASCKDLLVKFEKCLNDLYHAAENHTEQLTEEKCDKIFADEAWNKLRNHATNVKNILDNNIENCKKYLSEISQQINDKQTPAYLLEIKERLSWLARLVDLFSENNPELKSDEKKLSVLTHHGLFSAINNKKLPVDTTEHFLTAKAFYKDGNYAQALLLFSEIANSQQYNCSLYIYCADCFLALGDKATAIDCLGIVLAQDPSHQEALYRRSAIYNNMEDLFLARNDLDILLRINPNHLEARQLFNHIMEKRVDTFTKQVNQY